MTIDDLPHFRVSKVSPSENDKDDFELSGVFNRFDGVVEGLCSLLTPDAHTLTALYGYLQFGSASDRTARINTHGKPSPEVVDLDLTYVHPRWHPRHVWMVSLPTWKWNRDQCVARDAIGKIVEGTQMSVVDGEEIRQWIQISEKGKDSGLSRYYPVFPTGKSELRIEAVGIIWGGWAHEHCEL